jgi:hypothetical protein
LKASTGRPATRLSHQRQYAGSGAAGRTRPVGIAPCLEWLVAEIVADQDTG